MKVPICSKCKKPVEKLTINQKTLTWTVECHGETESVSVPVEFLKATVGPFKVTYKDAFLPKEEFPIDHGLDGVKGPNRPTGPDAVVSPD
jgi:hypothetical protein